MTLKEFKNKITSESKSNSSATVPLEKLKEKSKTVFGKSPQNFSVLAVLNSTALLAHENNSILRKKVIGKTDVDIAGLIQTLNNSDWVKQGREFYNPDERVCPFCQQETPHSLEKNLNEYFDDAFVTDTAAIEKLHTDYKADSEQFQQNVGTLLENPPQFLETEKLQEKSNILDMKIQTNIQRIEEKRRELSKSVELDSMSSLVNEINTFIADANSKIETHNTVASNLESEKAKLRGQVWRYLLDHEVASELTDYKNKKSAIDKAITSIEQKIANEKKKRENKEREIKALEKETTSIHPTIDGVNALLESVGFTGFAFAKSDQDQFYKIQRPDGSDVNETLSEGEKNFITFLYFYHLLKGSDTGSGITEDRVVVFDDPVSSLDSDILFIVSGLIKDLFDEVKNNSGSIKQIFVLTHNVYFHKEVSFNPQRHADNRLKDETFWTVRKPNEVSKIKGHDTNPIKTPYELLWSEVRNHSQGNPTIQNTMRRILEHYYKHLGNADPYSICAKFNGTDKIICRSFFAWAHDGSHFSPDSFHFSSDDSTVNIYLVIFKQIFEKTGHIAHYNMMMGTVSTEEQTKASESKIP